MAGGMEQFIRRDSARDFPMGLEVIINNDAESSLDDVGVVEVNATGIFHARVRWSPRIGDDGLPVYPSRGDHGLLIESDENEPWLVDWSPSA